MCAANSLIIGRIDPVRVHRVTEDKVGSLTCAVRDAQGEIYEPTDLPISYVHEFGQDLFDKIEQVLAGMGIWLTYNGLPQTVLVHVIAM